MAKKMGRPPIEINDKLFDTLIQLPLIKEDIANACFCSEDTLDRYIARRFESTFAVLKAQNHGLFKGRILGKQYEVAMRGNPIMLKWLGQQHLNQSDKLETKLQAQVETKESPNEQLERIKSMLKDEA